MHRGILLFLTAVVVAITVTSGACTAVDPGDAQVDAETVEFVSGSNSMSGTLYLPESSDPAPLLVVYHAASGGSVEFPFYNHLRTSLPRAGIATFLYDRRGTNDQPGEFGTASFEDLARDGIAAAKVLRNHHRIDGGRIGAWGVSQGGWVAVLAAQLSSDLSFAISVSGPGVSPAEQMSFTSTFHLHEAGFGSTVIETAMSLRAQVDDYYRRPDAESRVRVASLIDRYRAEKWFDLTFLPNGGHLPDDVTTAKWYYEMDFDPSVSLRKLDVPLLAVFGAQDRWVPVEASVAAIRSSVRPDLLSVYVSDDSGHLMSGAPEGPNYSGGDSAEREYIDRMIQWIGERR